MGLLFRKRLRLSKWLSLNLSKSGLGLSVGPPGAKVSVNQKRARMQLGIPGTGLGYRRDVSMPKDQSAPLSEAAASRQSVGLWLLAAGLILLIIWLSGCGFPAWRDQALRDVAEGRWHVDPAQVPPSGAGPSQTVEFYGPGGQHLGYGRVQGETVEFFNPDSSRSGFGRIGR